MSDTGLYSGVYSQLRSFAELFDKVLLTLKGRPGCQPTAEFGELGRLLVAAGSRDAANTRTQLLGTVLRETVEGDLKLAELGQALIAGTLQPHHIAALEALARGLENERAGMLGKMRGRGC